MKTGDRLEAIARMIGDKARDSITLAIAGRCTRMGRPQIILRTTIIGAISSKMFAGAPVILRRIAMIAGGLKMPGMRSWSAEVLLFLSSEHRTTPWVSRPMGWPECLRFRGLKREEAVGWLVPPSRPCLGLPTMGWPSSGAPRIYLGAVGWPVPPGRLPSWGGSVGWPG